MTSSSCLRKSWSILRFSTFRACKAILGLLQFTKSKCSSDIDKCTVLNIIYIYMPTFDKKKNKYKPGDEDIYIMYFLMYYQRFLIHRLVCLAGNSSRETTHGRRLITPSFSPLERMTRNGGLKNRQNTHLSQFGLRCNKRHVIDDMKIVTFIG